MDKIYFAKLRDNAVIPSKRNEDGGYDIYTTFEGTMTLYPGDIFLFPTGLVSAFDKKYRMVLKERGSSGSKGMSVRCGLIDSGYRGEWFVALNNTTYSKPIVITSDLNYKDSFGRVTYYTNKAICQAVLEEVPVVDVIESTYDFVKSFGSERQDGALGSSGK